MKHMSTVVVAAAVFSWLGVAQAGQGQEQEDKDSLYSWGSWASMIQPAAGPAPVESTPGDLEQISYNLRPELAGQFEPLPVSGPGPESPGVLGESPLPSEEATPPVESEPPVVTIPGAGAPDPDLPISPTAPNPPPPVPPEGVVTIPGAGEPEPELPVSPVAPNPPPPPGA